MDDIEEGLNMAAVKWQKWAMVLGKTNMKRSKYHGSGNLAKLY